jgi:hypothetical protein
MDEESDEERPMMEDLDDEEDDEEEEEEEDEHDDHQHTAAAVPTADAGREKEQVKVSLILDSVPLTHYTLYIILYM